jgi:hypothetical protein
MDSILCFEPIRGFNYWERNREIPAKVEEDLDHVPLAAMHVLDPIGSHIMPNGIIKWNNIPN